MVGMPILALVIVLSSAIQTARSIQNVKAWEAIRYAYVVDKSSPNFLSKGDVIFEVPAQGISDIIAISAKPTMNRKMVYSDSTQTASTKVEASLSLEGGYGAFSGAASMAVSSSSDSSIKTVRMDCYIKAIQYEVSAIGSLRTTPQNHLTENFKRSVKNLTPAQLEDMIGVFYARSLDLGGEVRKSYTMQATEQDNESSVNAEISAAYFGNSFTAKVGVSTRTTNKNAQMREDWSAKGGEATVWLQADPSEKDTSVQAKWAQTINDDNLFPFDFEMKPLWELVKAVDQQKGEEFERYLLDKWSRQRREFSPTRFLSVSEWTKHTTGNMRGSAIRHICPEGKRVVKVTWFEQNGYGLVDLQIDCGGEQMRFTNNNHGGPNSGKFCKDGFSAIQGREQNGYGIINARMWCIGDSHYSDSNRNYRGTFRDKLDCAGKVLTGLEVREQWGYGIINFKAYCTSSLVGDDEDPNLLKFNTASQSSTAWDGEPLRAIDGIIDGNWDSKSCTHTASAANSWWKGNLQQYSTVRKIVIYNRDDCCSDRIDGVKAYVGNVLCGQVAYQAGKRVYEITCANGVVGNTVTIRGGNVLTLCEVQVRGTPIDNGGELLQLNAASQSSTAWGGESLRAIDGNTDGNWDSKSCTHTASAANSWWKGNLQQYSTVRKIVIYNRDDCCSDRIDGVKAYVGNVLCGQVAYQAGKRVYEITCANGVVGNTVTIRGGNVLTLCEVQVKGSPNNGI